MRRLLALCAVAAAAVLGAPAQAQDFPSKLIHIIVPFTPGGSNDVLARELAAGFQARWKESAIVENRPGGGGIIAYTFVAKAPPDGYTLMVVPASFTMLPHDVFGQVERSTRICAAISNLEEFMRANGAAEGKPAPPNPPNGSLEFDHPEQHNNSD